MRLTGYKTMMQLPNGRFKSSWYPDDDNAERELGVEYPYIPPKSIPKKLWEAYAPGYSIVRSEENAFKPLNWQDDGSPEDVLGWWKENYPMKDGNKHVLVEVDGEHEGPAADSADEWNLKTQRILRVLKELS